MREIGQEVAIITCARKREKGQEGREGLGLTYAANFVRRRPQMRRVSDEKSRHTCVLRLREKEGKGGGGGGGGLNRLRMSSN
jgi:hypothetical protein